MRVPVCLCMQEEGSMTCVRVSDFIVYVFVFFSWSEHMI